MKVAKGDYVHYHPVLDEPHDGKIYKVASDVWTLGHGEAVVKLQGKSGSVCLTALSPAEQPEEEYRKEKAKEWRDRALRGVQAIIDAEAVDEEEVVVRDTICNLMHWCDEKGIDFQGELGCAGRHFEVELTGIE